MAPDEPPAESPRARVRALVDRVAARCDLPPLPAVAARALAIASSPEVELRDIADVVATDASLAARVLKISRSTIYLRKQAPRTLLDAVLTVGLKEIRRLLIAAAARSAYRADESVAGKLWAHALLTGIAADELAIRDGRPRGGPDFIAGILHDTGRLVLHLADAPRAAEVDDDEAREAERYGFSHATVGACLADRWGLEDEILEAILLHHVGGSECAIRLQTADRIAERIAAEDAALAPPWADEIPDGIEDVESAVADRFREERELFD